MTTSSGEPSADHPPSGGAGVPTPDPAPGAQAPRTPRFLTPPPSPSLSNSPELRKLLFFGLGLVLLLGITFLFKPRSEPADANADQRAPAPVESPEEHAKRVATMFGGALTRVVDGTDFDQSLAYLDIVREVANKDPKLVHEQATKILDWPSAVNAPSVLRGDIVRVRGLVADLRPEKLRQPAGRVEDVYRIFLAEPDGTEPVVADLVSRPNEPIEVKRDVVEVEGIFIRTVAFESGENQKRYEVPYLVGVNVEVIPPASSSNKGPLALVFLGVAVAVALVVAWLISKPKGAGDRRRHPALLNKPGVGMRELFEMRMREDEARRATTPAPTQQEPEKR